MRDSQEKVNWSRMSEAQRARAMGLHPTQAASLGICSMDAAKRYACGSEDRPAVKPSKAESEKPAKDTTPPPQNGVKWTKTEDDLLVAMTREGREPKQIAATLGRSVNSIVQRRMRVYGPMPQGSVSNGRAWTPEEDERLRTMVTDGAGRHEICAALGRSKLSVKRRLDRWRRGK